MHDPPPPSLEDRDLLAAACSGDEQAFAALADRHRAGLETYCVLMLGCPRAADRVVRASLALARVGVDHAGRRTTPRIWLYWVATQVCLAELDGRGEGVEL